MINKVAEDLGGIYGLVNHCPGPKAGTFEALTEADWADGYGRVKGGDKKPLPQPFQTLYTGKWIMYNNGPVTASSFSFQKRTAVPIKEAVAAFLLYFQPPLAVFLDFNSFPNILRPEFPLCSTHAYGILCGQRQSLAKAAPSKDLSFLDTQIQPAKSHFARQNHTAVVTTKTMYYYSCFFRRYPVK